MSVCKWKNKQTKQEIGELITLCRIYVFVSIYLPLYTVYVYIYRVCHSLSLSTVTGFISFYLFRWFLWLVVLGVTLGVERHHYTMYDKHYFRYTILNSFYKVSTHFYNATINVIYIITVSNSLLWHIYE